MSVQSEIDRIKANIASSYAKASEKGAQMPDIQNSVNLPATIESIPTSSLPDNVRTITVTSSDPEMGTVSGGGVASEGMTITLDALPTTGYSFLRWENGTEEIIKEKRLTIPVTGDVTLTARFEKYTGLHEWNTKALPISSARKGIKYVGNMFFVGTESSTTILYSENGQDWTESTLPYKYMDASSIAYGNGKYVGEMHNDIGVSGHRIIYSEDGKTWKVSTLGYTTENDYSGIVFCNGFFWQAGATLIKSQDGINWEEVQNPVPNAVWGRPVDADGSLYLFSSDNKLAYTKDGFNFSVRTITRLDGLSKTIANEVFYGNGLFVARDGWSFLYSVDGVTWNYNPFPLYAYPNSSKFVYGDGNFVCFNNKGNSIYYGSDLVNWEKVDLPVGFSANSITFGKDKFFAIDDKAATIAYTET